MPKGAEKLIFGLTQFLLSYLVKPKREIPLKALECKNQRTVLPK
jgi:hypothetical protein